MKTLIQTRKQLGLSQEAMAGLLGSTRSRLSHAEAGRRLLEPHAMQQFALLLQKLQEPLPAEPAISYSEALTKTLQEYVEDLQFRLTLLRRKQKKLVERQQQQVALSHCLQAFTAQKFPGKHTTKQQRKTKLVMANSAVQQERDNRAIFFLQLEMATLEFQLQYCMEFMKKRRPER